jgi:hypothetical protein
VSYQTIATLTDDIAFMARNRAAAVQQAEHFKDDTRADIAALADAVMLDAGGVANTFTRLAAAGPGIGDKVDLGDGSIDQALVTDADLLALTQGNWPTIAALYYDADGSPL